KKKKKKKEPKIFLSNAAAHSLSLSNCFSKFTPLKSSNFLQICVLFIVKIHLLLESILNFTLWSPIRGFSSTQS
ncbi:hypothetical protein GIB67_027223, partial [Kingdonia uniflora]